VIPALRSCARAMLGAETGLCVDAIAALQDPLLPGEAAQISRAALTRRRDYTAGRTAARLAMAELGWPAVPLLRGPGGAVIWPDRLTGSLSHCEDLCVAAVAQTHDVIAVGIDLERIQDLDPGMIETVCTPDEIAQAATRQDPGLWPLMIFNAKEAVFKAQYPLTRQMIDFQRVTVDLVKDGFTATFKDQTGPFAKGHVLSGRQTTVQGFVLASVMIRA
jgi:4'-phosphopantetheinyl transferase EntD